MVNERENSRNIYIDSEKGQFIVAIQGKNESYTFYAGKIEGEVDISNINIEKLTPIPDVFDYIEENDFHISPLSKKMMDFGGKRHGK